jgi:hypothetical protein
MDVEHAGRIVERAKEVLAKADGAEPKMTDAELSLVSDHISAVFFNDNTCRNDCPLPRDAELLLAEVRALREERDAARRKADAWQAKAVDAGRREIRSDGAARRRGVGFGNGGQ